MRTAKINRNPLVYPTGRAPGFDPSHVAAHRIAFSCVASGANFVNVLTGARGTIISGTPTTSILEAIGPGINFPTASDQIKVPGVAIDNVTGTLAVIFNHTGSSFPNLITSGSTGGAEVTFYLAPLVLSLNGWAHADVGSTATITAFSVPYFAATSWDGNGVNFILVNLVTGQTLTDTTGSTTFSGSADGFYLFGVGGGGNAPQGGIAAGMCSGYKMSLSELRQWANDPWSFWYPRKFDLLDMIKGSSGAVLTLTAAQGTFTESGKATIPNAARTIAAALGTFSESGKAIVLNRGIGMAGGVGSYNLTGVSASLPRGRTATASQGTFTFTGTASSLVRGHTVIAGPGSFTLTGVAVTDPVALSIKGIKGSYSVNGIPAVLNYTPFGAPTTTHSLPFLITMGPLTSR